MTDMRNTQKIALGGLLTSLSTVIMVISNIVPSGMYTFPAASGVVIYMISFLAGRSYAWSAFAATSMISFVFCTNKEASLCFIMLMGYYPMLKEHIEKIKLKFVQYLLKLAVFNAAAVLMYYLLLFVFSVPADNFEIFGFDLPLVFLAILNIVFLIYDYALTAFDRVYKKKINKFVTKIIKKL